MERCKLSANEWTACLSMDGQVAGSGCVKTLGQSMMGQIPAPQWLSLGISSTEQVNGYMDEWVDVLSFTCNITWTHRKKKKKKKLWRTFWTSSSLWKVMVRSLCSLREHLRIEGVQEWALSVIPVHKKMTAGKNAEYRCFQIASWVSGKGQK